MIHFKDSFQVPATPDVVMQRFMDVDGIASCVPGASIEGRDPEGNYLGMVTVALGPKKVNFRGKIRCEFDAASQSGVLTGGGVAAGRGASVQVRTVFLIREAPARLRALPVPSSKWTPRWISRASWRSSPRRAGTSWQPNSCGNSRRH